MLDILLTVDAGRLWRADQLGLFQPVDSDVLNARIPNTFVIRMAIGSASRSGRG